MQGAVVLSLALALAMAAPAVAEPRIRELSIVAQGGQVVVGFHLEGGFTPELVARIESGLPTGFVYDLELARSRKNWWDAGIESARVEVVAMFNAVTREYLVNTKVRGNLIDSRTLRDPGDLERAMTRFTALPVFQLETSPSRPRFLVRARVELGTGNLLGFIPYLRTTAWVESNKVRHRSP